MALIACRECGREVSDQAAACPGCGAPPLGTSATIVAPVPIKKGGAGRVILWLAIILIGGPIVLFFGSAIIAGIMEGASRTHADGAKPYTGKIRIDAGTEYEMVDSPSTIGGECTGWNTVSVQDPNSPARGMTNLMCWRRVGDMIEVNTATGQGRRQDPAAVFTD